MATLDEPWSLGPLVLSLRHPKITWQADKDQSSKTNVTGWQCAVLQMQSCCRGDNEKRGTSGTDVSGGNIQLVETGHRYYSELMEWSLGGIRHLVTRLWIQPVNIVEPSCGTPTQGPGNPLNHGTFGGGCEEGQQVLIWHGK